MSKPRRTYVSSVREQGAEATRARILAAARELFGRHGLDKVTIASIAARARVASPTVYAAFKSKEGLLRAIMRAAMFGERFEAARRRLEGVADPVEMIALTPEIARSVYDGESRDLALVRGAAGFSPALRKVELEFEDVRFTMQERRVRLLFEQGKARKGLTFEEARRILWMYTSREVYRLLVHESGWTGARYESWLRETLLAALVEP